MKADTPTRAGPATKTVAWRRTEPVVTIEGETTTFGSDNGDQPGNDINTTTTSGGSNSTGDTNGDSSNSVGVYSVSSPRPCRLIAPTTSNRDVSARSSSNPSPHEALGLPPPSEALERLPHTTLPVMAVLDPVPAVVVMRDTVLTSAPWPATERQSAGFNEARQLRRQRESCGRRKR